MITTPAHVEWIEARIHEQIGHRLVVIFQAPGCSYASSKGGCTNCSFAMLKPMALGQAVSADEYVTQLEAALVQIPPDDPGPIQLDLFVSGSFFCPDEVPPAAQRRLLEKVAHLPSLRRITIESRPEYVTLDNVEGALVAVQPSPGVEGVEVEVAIGLESADKHIRERRIRKGFSWRQFEKAVTQLARSGASLMVYLLLKPIDTPEAEAIEDVVESAHRVCALADKLSISLRLGLQPCFVGPASELAQQAARGAYRPPWLWSVVECVQRMHGLAEIQIDLSQVGLPIQHAPHNCERCSDETRKALKHYNLHQDPTIFAGLQCACQPTWREQLNTRSS